MKLLFKFYFFLFVLLVIIIIYTFFYFVFVDVKSPIFIFCSIVSFMFLGVSGIQLILKNENVDYQVRKKRYKTIQQANYSINFGIRITLVIGIVFAIISLVGIVFPNAGK